MSTVDFGERDSSSAEKLVPTDRQYGWPPQNDNGEGNNSVHMETGDSSSANNFVANNKVKGWPPQNNKGGSIPYQRKKTLQKPPRRLNQN